MRIVVERPDRVVVRAAHFPDRLVLPAPELVEDQVAFAEGEGEGWRERGRARVSVTERERAGERA